MRNFRVKKVSDEYVEESDLLLDIEVEEFPEHLEIFDPKNIKFLRSYVMSVKKIIRYSYEYKEMVKILRYENGMDRCGNHPNILHELGFKIHIHHYPYTIEDIIYTVLYKQYATRKKSDEPINMQSVADEVMYLHFTNIIGLYSLCKTCHDYDHSLDNDVYIPMSLLYGDPDIFYQIYKEHMQEPLQEKSETYFNADKLFLILQESVPIELMKHYIRVKDIKTNQEYLSIEKFGEFIEKTFNK